MSHENCVYQEELSLPLASCTRGMETSNRQIKCLNNIHFKRVVTVGVVSKLAGPGKHGKGAFELTDYITDKMMVVHVRFDTAVHNEHGLPPKRYQILGCRVYVGDKVEFMGMVFGSPNKMTGYAKRLKRLRDTEFLERIKILNEVQNVDQPVTLKRRNVDFTPSDFLLPEPKKLHLVESTAVIPSEGSSQHEKQPVSESIKEEYQSESLQEVKKIKCEEITEWPRFKKFTPIVTVTDLNAGNTMVIPSVGSSQHEKQPVSKSTKEEYQSECLQDVKTIKCEEITEWPEFEEFTSIIPVTDLDAEKKRRVRVASVSWCLKYVIDCKENVHVSMRVFGKMLHTDKKLNSDFILLDPFKTDGLTVKVTCERLPPKDLYKVEDRYLLLEGDMNRMLEFKCKQIMEFSNSTDYNDYSDNFFKEATLTVFRRKVQLNVIEILNTVEVAQFLYEVGAVQFKVIELYATIVAINKNYIYLSDETGIMKAYNNNFDNPVIGTSVVALGGIVLSQKGDYNSVIMRPFKVTKIRLLTNQNIHSACGFVYCLKLSIRDALGSIFTEDNQSQALCRIIFCLAEFVGYILCHKSFIKYQRIVVGDGTAAVQVYVSDLDLELDVGMYVQVTVKIKNRYSCIKLFDAEVSVLPMKSYIEQSELLYNIYEKVYLPRLGFTRSTVTVPKTGPPHKRRTEEDRYLNLSRMRSADVFRIPVDKASEENPYEMYRNMHFRQPFYVPFVWNSRVRVKLLPKISNRLPIKKFAQSS